MRNKKWLSLVLAVVMLFSAIPFGAFAEKKEATVSMSINDKTLEDITVVYGQELNIIATATAEGFDKNSTDHSDEFTLEYYKVVSGKDDEKLDAKPKAAGNYKVRVLLADSSTHTGEAEQKFTIEQKTLTIEGLKATDRKYDESSDKVQITGTAQLVGVESGDTVTLNNTQPTEGTIQGYVDNGKPVPGSKRLANGLPVIVDGLALEGKDKDNYTLDANLTVNIWDEVDPLFVSVKNLEEQRIVLISPYPEDAKGVKVKIQATEGDDIFDEEPIIEESKDGDFVLVFYLKGNLDATKKARVTFLWEAAEDHFNVKEIQPIHLTEKAAPVRFVEDMVFDYTGKPLTVEQFNLPKKFYIDDKTGEALLEKADGTREVPAGEYSFSPELSKIVKDGVHKVAVTMKETEHLAERIYGIKVTIKLNVTGNSGSGSGGSSHASVRPGSKDSKDVSKPTDKTDKTPAQTSVTPSAKAVLTIGSKSYMTKDGMKPMDVAPMLHQGRTMLPARMIAELLGVNVAYNATNKTASFEYTNGDAKNTVALTLGQKMMKVNGKDVALTADLIVVNGRILLPIRDIQKALKDLGLNIEIDWNAQTREVSIK